PSGASSVTPCTPTRRQSTALWTSGAGTWRSPSRARRRHRPGQWRRSTSGSPRGSPASSSSWTACPGKASGPSPSGTGGRSPGSRRSCRWTTRRTASCTTPAPRPSRRRRTRRAPRRRRRR
ncbi:unnamed protein product, partial [Prorocentrum cordatum]